MAVTWDDCPTTWFVPRELLLTGWWADALSNADSAANHNIKYDAHVSSNDLGVDALVVPELRCTLTGAKIVDSDRMTKGGYGLDALSKAWCGRDIDEYYWRLTPYLYRNKDYGRVPIDTLAEYACEDVLSNRLLDQYLDASIHEDCHDVWANERRVTKLLVKMERRGVCVDPTNLKIKQLEVLMRLLQIDEELERLVGRSFRPHVSEDCYDVLVNQYGLPVLGFTDTGNASFDAAALEKYLVHPQAPQKVVELIVDYRELNTFNSLFLETWSDLLGADGRLHATYNQSVRTGRMSCGEPNMQQLSKMAKELIVPPPGQVIVSADWSQIEFRIIVHYIENKHCIDSYLRDPWTDFHTWVAEMVGMDRGPAKNVNFMMGYGGGKNKCVQMLSADRRVIGSILEEVGDDPRRVRHACQVRAESVYSQYHSTLPELKPTTHAAMSACRRRGYARNHYGRHRHLPPQFSHKAFNSCCQSTAGDIMKERMVALDDKIPELEQIAQVHDNVVGYMDAELATETMMRRVCGVMNDIGRPLKVPVRTSIGWSGRNWKEAGGMEVKFK